MPRLVYLHLKHFAPHMLVCLRGAPSLLFELLRNYSCGCGSSVVVVVVVFFCCCCGGGLVVVVVLSDCFTLWCLSYFVFVSVV